MALARAVLSLTPDEWQTKGEIMTRWMRRSVKLSMFGLVLLAAGACGIEVTPVVKSTPSAEAGQLPPISGGSLLVTRDGVFAVAGDADSDRIIVWSIAAEELAFEMDLEAGDEPGRMVEGAAGVVHVALRRGASVLRLDIPNQSSTRRPACPAPRGLAFDAGTNELHLACAGGELLTYDAAGAAAAKRVLQVGRDLRDVMVRPGGLLLTQFRSPALIQIDAAGEIQGRQTPPVFKGEHLQQFSNQNGTALFAPTVAWRTRLLPDGRAVMVHQRAMMGEVGIHPEPNQPKEVPSSSYGGSVAAEFECRPPIVHAAVTVFDADGQPSSEDLPLTSFGGLHRAVLPVDFALSADGQSIAIAATGSRTVKIIGQHAVSTRDASHNCQALGTDVQIPGQPISVAFTADDDVLVQTRGPAALWRIRQPGAQVEMLFRFPGENLRNSGHEIFHNRASEHSDIACASCHPGGRDDGHTWNFSELGLRRTQSLVGGLLATLPLHWDGDMEDVNQIMDEVFIERMGGDQPHPARRAQLALWLDGLQPLDRWAALDRDAVKRGQSLFNDPVVACASCHSGARYTNNKTVDVGTGLALQVPGLLGIGDRAPYMHDGCAPDLAARFVGNCGGGDAHGKTSDLSTAQIGDLVAYLETL